MNLRAQTRLRLPEFTVLMAMLFAIIAFSIDAMLPAMGQIASELSPNDPNRAQLVVMSFVLGMGVGTLFTGPMADAWGRKPVIIWGGVVFCIGSVIAWYAQSLELVLAARILQGLGAAGPRIASMAIMRDLYAGRQMARVMSLAMMVFVFVPAVAPMIGSWIMAGFGWRAIFLSFVVFATINCGWLAVRQPETIAKPDRRPLRLAEIRDGVKEVLTIPRVVIAIVVLSFAFTLIFLTLVTLQQIFEHSFGRSESFPYWFALISVLSAPGGYLNAKIVERLGMRYLIAAAFSVQMVLATLMTCVVLLAPTGDVYFGIYLLWILSVMLTAGFTIGNLNALSLEPLGHIAGLASSVISAVSTIISAAITAGLGRFLDGTPLAPAMSIACLSIASVWLIGRIRDEQPA